MFSGSITALITPFCGGEVDEKAFQEFVDYDIQFVGGIKTAFFGGEGLFFAKLTGPGTVYLQTLPFSRLADRVASATRSSTGAVKRGGPISGILGDIVGGDR